MQQAADLAGLIDELRQADGGLRFGLFTGYTERELDSGLYSGLSKCSHLERRQLWQQIRQRLDFAVMGRYNRLQPSTEALCSSRNQRLRLFSDRYTLDDFPRTHSALLPFAFCLSLFFRRGATMAL